MYETLEHWSEWIKETEEQVDKLSKIREQADKVFTKEQEVAPIIKEIFKNK
tara:strand:+ start:311 stop:463 length:153 start_codon:yes stop_codon:yes gene_type:complete